MKITKESLRKQNACEESLKFGTEHDLIGMEAVPLMERLIELEEVDWALWLLVRVMSRKQCIQFACHCARSVLHIFEERFPGDERPRNTIEAASKFGTPDFDEKICKAYAANDAYDAAYYAAKAATNAAYYAANDANATNDAAAYDANSAYATYAAKAANDAAHYAANASKCDKKVKLADFVRIGIDMMGKVSITHS
jgi:hypothetical protein